jgi:hypothetical protein
MMRVPLLVALLLLAAGCSEPEAAPEPTPTAGLAFLDGVVVDQAIRPVAGALVEVAGADVSATTGSDGAFRLELAPGSHLLQASHPSYAALTQPVVLPESGLSGLVLQFTLKAAEGPYHLVTKYDGFIVCSLAASFVFSEECGEGVGTPAGRVGKQGNNAIRYDFQAESASLKTVVVEQAWEPTSDAGRELQFVFATAWTCEPACGGEAVGDGGAAGPSPLLLRVDEEALAPHLADPASVFTTYTLARTGATASNLILNQPFQLFVSQFYRAAGPEGYSFVAAA